MDTTELQSCLRDGVWIKHQQYGRIEREGDQRSSAPNEAADVLVILERQIADLHAAYGHSQQQFVDAMQENERSRSAVSAAATEERERILALIPGGSWCDPQALCDLIRETSIGAASGSLVTPNVVIKRLP